MLRPAHLRSLPVAGPLCSTLAPSPRGTVVSRRIAVVAVVVALALTGCASPEVDQAEIAAWTAQQNATTVTGSLGAIGGQPDAEAPGDTESQDDGTKITFASPVDVVRAEFSCFGEGTMSVTVGVSGGAVAISQQGVELACADSPHVIELGTVGTEVRASAYDSSRDSAWNVDFLGE